jgi:hypothetical protein
MNVWFEPLHKNCAGLTYFYNSLKDDWVGINYNEELDKLRTTYITEDEANKYILAKKLMK